ncbi:Na+/H+ antiporter subunit E [Agaribacter flavus]|uniref:Na+/H+ antiporter subunit E n=1 Tax=Agaribacter flavus TaxID=1902781 RepID=A0ABV7FYB4_9ALTE
MTHTIRLAIILVITWLLLSGMFEPLMLAFGLFSVVFSLWITSRMLKIDQERYSFFVTGSFLSFLLKLFTKVIASNIDVCARILGFKPIQSTFVTIHLPFKDDVAKVLYANAITLTPGSSSIAMDDNTLLIHTVSEQGAQDLINGDMLNIMPKQYAITKIEIAQ